MDDRYAINAAVTELREGYAAGDVERVLAVYADGFGDLTDGMPSFGHEESKLVFRERLRLLFAGETVEFVSVSMDILLFGETAVDLGWQTLVLTSRAGGEVTQVRTRYMQMWKKMDGGWRIALFLNNADQPPMLAEEMIVEMRSKARVE